jgi:hypothetical protein
MVIPQVHWFFGRLLRGSLGRALCRIERGILAVYARVFGPNRVQSRCYFGICSLVRELTKVVLGSVFRAGVVAIGTDVDVLAVLLLDFTSQMSEPATEVALTLVQLRALLIVFEALRILLVDFELEFGAFVSAIVV